MPLSKAEFAKLMMMGLDLKPVPAHQPPQPTPLPLGTAERIAPAPEDFLSTFRQQHPWVAKAADFLTFGATDPEYTPGPADLIMAAMPFMKAMHLGPQAIESPQAAAEAYSQMVGFGNPAPHAPVNINPAYSKRVADAYQAMMHNPGDPKVRAAYEALASEVSDQFNFMTREAGITAEPWTQSGQPYKNSAAMRADVEQNKHLWYFPSDQGFGMNPAQAGNPLLKLGPSGRPVNDELRAVHDYFAHAKGGWEFGPKGEENAFLEHAKLFSPAARPALATETRGQNSWVNFGEHLRDTEGNVPGKGEPGFVAPQDRPFAAQKTGLLPEAFQQANVPTERTSWPDWMVSGLKKLWTDESGHVVIPGNTPTALADLIKVRKGTPEFRASALRSMEQAVKAGEGTAENWHPLPEAPFGSPENREVFARMWGATSPKTPVSRNNYEALRAWQMAQRGETPFTRANTLANDLTTVNSKWPNLNRAILGQPLSSRAGAPGKTEDMAQLLLGTPGATPIDVQALSGVGASEEDITQAMPKLRPLFASVLKVKPRTLTYPQLYRMTADVFQKGLQEFGAPFAQYWEGVKTLKGQGVSQGFFNWLKTQGLTEPGAMLNEGAVSNVTENIDRSAFYGRQPGRMRQLLKDETGSLTLDLEHYSPKVGLSTVDPTYQGTGSRGAEGARASDPEYLPRAYYYLKGTPPEGRFRGQQRYSTSVLPTSIYDMARDPLGLKAQAQQQAPRDPSRMATVFESLVAQHGFLGYQDPDYGIVAVFQPLPVK